MSALQPAVSILVVSYNTAAMTRACLDSIPAGAAETDHEVIVVDNASSDGSAAMVAKHPSRPRLVALDRNLGFGAANNLAAKEARGAFILLLNPDTVVEPGAIDRLMAFARGRPEARIWGGVTRFADGRLNTSNAWARMTLWNLACRASGLTGLAPASAFLNGEAYGGWLRDSVREVDIVSGCFLLVGRPFWEQLGGFDPTFFMYGEEADLCLRARRLGARPAVTPTAIIVHHGGASEPTRMGKMEKLLAAKATLIRRHLPAVVVPVGLGLLAAWPLSRWLVHRARAVLRGATAAEEAATWRQLFMSRRQWLAGYRPGVVHASTGMSAVRPLNVRLAKPLGEQRA